MKARRLRWLLGALSCAACSSVLGIEEGTLDPALSGSNAVLTNERDADANAVCAPFDNHTRLTKPFDHLLPLPD